MAARWRWIVLAVLPAAVLLACSRDAAQPHAVTNDDLRAMALRVEDLPPGFTLADEKLTTNQELADQTNDPPTVRSLLDGWGRDTGLQTVFTAAGAGDRPRQPVLIAGSADHFADDQHARQAFAGQRGMLKYAKTPFVGRSTFQAPHLGDQAAGLRMYTTSAEAHSRRRTLAIRRPDCGCTRPTNTAPNLWSTGSCSATARSWPT